MQREEHSGYFKYGVLLISISVWFCLPKMRTPLLLVLFHKTLLAGTGKQWDLQPYTLHGQTTKCLAGRAGCGLSLETGCFYCRVNLQRMHSLMPQQFAQAASSISPSGAGTQKTLSCSFCPILHLIQAFSCNHLSNLLESARPQRRWHGHITSCTAVPAWTDADNTIVSSCSSWPQVHQLE